MDISSLVRNVVAAFDKAVTLVQRIQDRKDVKDDPQSMADLVTSLSLGPVVIRGYFDSDVKRFGDAYTVGDQLAREQLKDVLIALQQSLLFTLQSVWMDEQELDYNALLETSDNCRVNAGVCLGQLSQRLVEHARMYAQTPPAYVSGGTYVGGLQHTLSQSTYSSSGANRTPDPNVGQFSRLNLNGQTEKARPRAGHNDSFDSWTSDNQTSFFHERDPETRSMRRPSSNALAPEDLTLLSPVTSPTSNNAPTSLPGADNLVRESYVTLGGLPIDSGSARSSSNSNVSAPVVQNNMPQSRDRFGPDDYSPSTITQANGGHLAFGSLYERQQSVGSMRQSTTSYANRAYGAGLEPTATLTSVPQFPTYGWPSQWQQPQPPSMQGQPFQQQQYVEYVNGYPPRAESYSSPIVLGRKPLSPNLSPVPQQVNYQTMPRPSVSAPIPVQMEAAPPNSSSPRQQIATRPRNDSGSARSNPRSPTPGRSTPNTPRQPQQASFSDQNQLRNTSTNATYASNTSVPRSVALPPTNGPLNLPTEKNSLGFCKAATRMFMGMEKKTLVAANRPFGLATVVPYWRCDKCNFEGPMAHITVSPPGAKKVKQEKCYDKTVREMYGIRYRWAFLAKCHVHLKQLPPEGQARKSGTFGSYGCIFCAAESHLRNWTLAPPSANFAASDAASTRSNSSAGQQSTTSSGGGKDTAPIFGNLESFMGHLHKHRSEDWWPNSEMQNRMKCVVGRVAEATEDFEVNFMPLSATNGV